MRTRLVLLALALAAIASAFLLLAPTGTGTQAGRTVSVTLLQVNGSSVLGLLLVPIVICLIPLLFPGRPPLITAFVLLCAFVLVGSFTVGLFYVPAAAVMLVAVGRKPSKSAPLSAN